MYIEIKVQTQLPHIFPKKPYRTTTTDAHSLADKYKPLISTSRVPSVLTLQAGRQVGRKLMEHEIITLSD